MPTSRALHVLTKPYTDDLIEIIKRIETKPPAYSAQGQYQQPQGGLGYGAQDMGQQAEVPIVIVNLKALGQFANEQESRGRGSYQDSSPSGGFSPSFNPEVLEVIIIKSNNTSQFHQQQHGQDSKAKGRL